MPPDGAIVERLLLGLAVSLSLAVLGSLARTLSRSGVVAATLVGTAVWTGLGGRGFVVLAAFFVLASGLTRLGYRRKAAAGLAEARGGRRSAAQVVANGGVAAVAALAAVTLSSTQVAALVFVAAFATAAADTAATEVGQLWGRRTFLVTTGRPVPRGTDGGVSLPGTLASVAAAALVAAVGAAVGLYPPAAAALAAAAGFLGGAADSLLGATLERRGRLDNDRVNLLATASGAFVALVLAWIVL